MIIQNHVFYDACESGDLETVKKVLNKEYSLTWTSPIFMSKGLAHALSAKKYDLVLYVLEHVDGLDFQVQHYSNSLMMLRQEDRPQLQEAVCRAWAKDPTLRPKDLGKDIIGLFAPSTHLYKKAQPLWHDLTRWEPLMRARSSTFMDETTAFLRQAIQGSYAKSEEHAMDVLGFITYWEKVFLQDVVQKTPPPAPSTSSRKL